MNPQPSWADLEPYYNDLYSAYEPTHGAQGSDEEEIERAKTTGLIRHIALPTSLRILDVGCGGGQFLRLCKKLGAIEQGVEPSKHAAEIARRQGLNVFHGTLEEHIAKAQPDTQFDVITANHVIEHTPDPVATLGAMKKLLAPKGYIWIAVPNAAYPIARALKGHWHSSDLPYHLMHFSPSSIKDAGHRAGLIVRSQRTLSEPQFVAGSLSQFLRRRFYVPSRVARSLGLSHFARWYSRRVDAKGTGECLLTEFTL